LWGEGKKKGPVPQISSLQKEEREREESRKRRKKRRNRARLEGERKGKTAVHSRNVFAVKRNSRA